MLSPTPLYPHIPPVYFLRHGQQSLIFFFYRSFFSCPVGSLLFPTSLDSLHSLNDYYLFLFEIKFNNYIEGAHWILSYITVHVRLIWKQIHIFFQIFQTKFFTWNVKNNLSHNTIRKSHKSSYKHQTVKSFQILAQQKSFPKHQTNIFFSTWNFFKSRSDHFSQQAEYYFTICINSYYILPHIS